MTSTGGQAWGHRCRPWCRALAAAWLIVGVPALAQADPLPEVVGMRIGFDGRYKLGRWTTLEIALRGGDQPAVGYLSVVVPDGDDSPSQFTTPANRPLQVLPGLFTRGVLHIKLGRDVHELTVRFTTVEGKKVETTFSANPVRGIDPLPLAVDDEQKLYVIVGQPIGLPTATGNKPPEQVVLADASQLPTRWFGYDAVDVLVFSTSQVDTFRQLREESAQLAALEEWLNLGGRLVLCVGAEARSVLDGASPLARFAPGKLADVETLNRGDALEKFVGTTHRIPFTGRGESKGLLAARLERPQGLVVVEEGDLPLIIRTPRGFGEITFVALDLDRRPIAAWQGRGALAKRLVEGFHRPRSGQSATGPTNSFPLGFTDLAGQLRGAIDQFVGVRIVPFWIVGTLIFGYILLVGPIDYLLVRRVFKRMELTWITFPLIVLLVSVSAYAAACWTKGSQLRINQVDLVDLDMSSGQVRGTSWQNIFSPTAASYDLSLAPAKLSDDEAAPQLLFSWLGLPGSAWGGMQGTANGPQLFSRAYNFSDHLDALLGVPIDVWSTKSFTGRWHARVEVPLEAALVATDRQTLEGTLTSRLPCALDDALLVYDRWAYPLGRLEPGRTTTLDPRGERDLQTVLKGFHTVKNPKNDTLAFQAAPFDPSSYQVPGILRQMMFYEAAGAEQYTGLSNRYQPFVDLSSHLDLHQAILVGQVADPQHHASQLERDGLPLAGELEYWAFYRFLVPVKSSGP